MLTQLGIFLRKLRLEYGEIMKDMAAKLDISSSFLSAVENGKKKMPEPWYDTIVNLYNLDKEKQDELMIAIEESQKSAEINLEDLSKEKKIGIFICKRIIFTTIKSIVKLQRIGSNSSRGLCETRFSINKSYYDVAQDLYISN